MPTGLGFARHVPHNVHGTVVQCPLSNVSVLHGDVYSTKSHRLFLHHYSSARLPSRPPSTLHLAEQYRQIVIRNVILNTSTNRVTNIQRIQPIVIWQKQQPRIPTPSLLTSLPIGLVGPCLLAWTLNPRQQEDTKETLMPHWLTPNVPQATPMSTLTTQQILQQQPKL